MELQFKSSDSDRLEQKKEMMPKEKKAHKASMEDMEEKLELLMQKQIDHEFENARLYLAMAIWCQTNGYTETAKFFSGHALEERKHGMDFINSLIVMEMPVRQPITKEMKGDYENLEEVLVDAVDREVMTSIMIGKLHKCAIMQGSLLSRVTEEYIEEQYEEEQLFKSILNLFKLHKNKDSLASFESQIGQLTERTGKYMIGKLPDGLHV